MRFRAILSEMAVCDVIAASCRAGKLAVKGVIASENRFAGRSACVGFRLAERRCLD
jgi:hypothetical protein